MLTCGPLCKWCPPCVVGRREGGRKGTGRLTALKLTALNRQVSLADIYGFMVVAKRVFVNGAVRCGPLFQNRSNNREYCGLPHSECDYTRLRSHTYHVSKLGEARADEDSDHDPSLVVYNPKPDLTEALSTVNPAPDPTPSLPLALTAAPQS